MKNIWEFLNGKKTVIAAIISLVIGFLHTREIIDASTTEFLLALNTILLGVGVGHKINKVVKSKKV